MARAYSFRPRLWAFSLAAIACIVFVSLGSWQSRRAAEKRELGAALDLAAEAAPVELPARDVIHKRVAARGTFLPERTVLLDNKLRRGRPGYEVVTPLRLADSSVLVNRGWMPAPPSRDTVPAVRTPSGEVRVEGIALERIPHALSAGAASGRVRQNLDIAAFGAETGLRLLPLVLEQHSDLDDGLVRDWPRPDLGVEKHESYSLQWYSFAALAVALALILSFRRVTPP
jgi:surfeit locus 1 family protein